MHQQAFLYRVSTMFGADNQEIKGYQLILPKNVSSVAQTQTHYLNT